VFCFGVPDEGAATGRSTAIRHQEISRLTDMLLPKCRQVNALLSVVVLQYGSLLSSLRELVVEARTKRLEISVSVHNCDQFIVIFKLRVDPYNFAIQSF
jgi:hypothetical protein